MPLESGCTFAGFTILKQIGAGGMGEVYLAAHPRLPRQEALKILPAQLCTDSEYRARFHREAELAATLWHPNIVSVHDMGENDGQLWLSMDYVDGTDAAQLLRDQHPKGLPRKEVAAIISAVAEALEYAHEHELLHRDVKPSNILLSKTTRTAQRILLADFGIARSIYGSDITATNVAVGTVNYASPEQLTGATVDARSDQYSLAATAFQLLCGKYPFDHSNPAVVIGHHLNTPPPRLGLARPKLGAFDDPLSTAMAKRPADRFPSCRDFAEAFAAAAEKPRPTAPRIVAPLSPGMPPTLPAHPPLGHIATPTGPPPAARPSLKPPSPSPAARPSLKPPSPPPIDRASSKPPSWALIAVAATLVVIAVVLALSIPSPSYQSDDHQSSSTTLYTTTPPYYPPTTSTTTSTTTWYPEPTTTESYPQATTPVEQPRWDGIWLRGYWEANGDCASPRTYWVVQPGDSDGMSALKVGCFPDSWINALNDTGHNLKWGASVYFAVWDPGRIMSEYNRRGDLQMIGLAKSCLARAGLTDFHEGPIHNDCLIKPRL